MKQKYLREFIPLFEAEDNEELVEGLIVMGIKSFLNTHGTIKRGSGKLLRETVESICLDFEKSKSGELSSYRELSKQIENVSRKLDSSKSDIKSEISSIRGERQTVTGFGSVTKSGVHRSHHSQSDNNPPSPTKDAQRSRDEKMVPAGFQKKEEGRKLDAANSSTLVYKKPSVNQESANSIWHQPEYLVDQKHRPTAKITQMQPPPLEPRSRAMSQDIKKPTAMRYSAAGSISAIGNEGAYHSEMVFGAESQPVFHAPKPQRPGSADPRTRYALPGGQEVLTPRHHLPIAPSSESEQMRRQQVQTPRLHSEHDVILPRQQDVRRPASRDHPAFTVDAHSILMSESVSLHAEQTTPTARPNNQMIFIPAGNQAASPAISRPPVAKKAGQQIISGVNNYTNVLSGSKVGHPPAAFKKKQAPAGVSNAKNAANSRRGSQDKGKAIQEWPGSMNLDKQPRSASKPASVRSQGNKTPLRGNSVGLPANNNQDLQQRPPKNYKQVQSRIKDLVRKDREKWTGQEIKLSGLAENYGRGLDQVEFLTQEECTFRPEDEMMSRAEAQEYDDHDSPHKLTKEAHGGFASRSRDTLDMSQDESSLTSTKHLLKQDKTGATRFTGSQRKRQETGPSSNIGPNKASLAPAFRRSSEDDDDWRGDSQREARNQKQWRAEQHDQQELNTSGVVGIASKLLNSDIMKRLESRNQNMLSSDFGEQDRGMWRDPPGKSGMRRSGMSDDASSDEGAPKPSGKRHQEYSDHKRSYDRDQVGYHQQESLDPRHKDKVTSHHSKDISRKEEFDQDDYDMDFHNTSRASSSQFSAFCPGEDVKSFFKQEFPSESPALTHGTTTASKERQFFPKQAGGDTVGDHSYSSSKLTYGPMATLPDPKASQRSHHFDGR